MIFGGAKVDGTTINDKITTNIPADAYYIATSGDMVVSGMSEVNSPSGKIKWNSWSSGAGGYTGIYTETKLKLAALNLGYGYSAQIHIYAGTAPPSAGDYVVGDIVINRVPAVGSPKGWTCTVSGNPGTWVSQGNL